MATEQERYILFVRHGETDCNKERRVGGSTDIPLNDHGKKQGELCAPALKQIIADSELNIKIIYSSAQLRAFETALIIQKELRIPIIATRDLREIDFGLCEKLAWEEEVKLLYPDVWKQYKKDRSKVVFPGGENMEKDVFPRVDKELKTILKKEKKNDVLIVCHRGVIKVGITLLCGFPPEAMNHFTGIGNSAIVPMKMENGRWTLWLGWSPHLVDVEGYNIKS